MYILQQGSTLVYSITVSVQGKYKFEFVTFAPTTGTDSFNVRLKGGPKNINEFEDHLDLTVDKDNLTTTTWKTHTLDAGNYTLEIGYRNHEPCGVNAIKITKIP